MSFEKACADFHSLSVHEFLDWVVCLQFGEEHLSDLGGVVHLSDVDVLPQSSASRDHAVMSNLPVIVGLNPLVQCVMDVLHIQLLLDFRIQSARSHLSPSQHLVQGLRSYLLLCMLDDIELRQRKAMSMLRSSHE